MNIKLGDWLAGIFFWLMAALSWPFLEYGRNKKIIFAIFIIELLVLVFLAVCIFKVLLRLVCRL